MARLINAGTEFEISASLMLELAILLQVKIFSQSMYLSKTLHMTCNLPTVSSISPLS